MKLSSDPKPVKFRIVSGGEEHSSLDSLRRCLCVSDLQKIEKQFIQWLNRQGTEGEEIAKQLNLHDINSAEDYFAVYKLFFSKEFKNSIDSPVKLLEYWYAKEKSKYSENISHLIKLGFGKDDDITIFCYRHQDEFKGLTNDWLATLKNIRTKTKEVNEWIIQKESSKVNPMIKSYIISNWNKKMIYDDSLYSKSESAILNFAKICNTIIKSRISYFEAREMLGMSSFLSEQSKFDLMRKDDFLFDAKLFVLLLLFKKQYQIVEHPEWEKEFIRGISLRKREVISQYKLVMYFDLYNILEVFVINDLFKFLELE